MRKIPLFFGLLGIIASQTGILFSTSSRAQTTLSNENAKNVILGNYNPQNFIPSNIISDKDDIIDDMLVRVSEDSLKSYLTKLETFHTRNTGSDTVAKSTGIGAARRWIYSKFQDFSSINENRLLTGYLNFFNTTCGMPEHRNVFGVLPGTDTSKKEIVFVEAHMDSRCESSCNDTCYAPGMDDNGSGTVLVMELARVMSKYAFERTIVFTTVTGEEQGLRGGEAWSDYFLSNNVKVLACLNNNVVGGVECGQRSSPPSCSPEGAIDSVNLRVFSHSASNDTNFLSIHKQLARFIELQQNEEINPRLDFGTEIMMQIREDRQGRGGDHIPFRANGFTAIRFTSSHEHGNGSGQPPDHQHSTRDVLGYDKSVPPDGIIDSFLINFGYLRRNTLTNGVNLALLSMAPPSPVPVNEYNGHGVLSGLRFEGQDTLFSHRIGVRSNHSDDLYFDTIIDVNGHFISASEIPIKGDVQLHPMNVSGEVESIPAFQIREESLEISEDQAELNCMHIYPNPTEKALNINWKCSLKPQSLEIRIYDVEGILVKSLSHIDQGTSQLNVNDWKSGAYKIISIVNNDEVFHNTVVIY